MGVNGTGSPTGAPDLAGSFQKSFDWALDQHMQASAMMSDIRATGVGGALPGGAPHLGGLSSAGMGTISTPPAANPYMSTPSTLAPIMKMADTIPAGGTGIMDSARQVSEAMRESSQATLKFGMYGVLSNNVMTFGNLFTGFRSAIKTLFTGQ